MPVFFTSDHEWIDSDGATATVGITMHAQDALGDVVYVELPSVGLAVVAGSSCAEVESTKSVSEIYAPVSGLVAEVNEQLVDEPELINRDPYGAGWIFVVELADADEVDALLDAGAYKRLVEED